MKKAPPRMSGGASTSCLSKTLQCEKIFINIFTHLIMDLKTGRNNLYNDTYTENCTGILLSRN